MISLDNLPPLIETAVSLGILGVLWRINRFLNTLWDALKTAPPHLHMNGKVFYPPPFKKPEFGPVEVDGRRP